MKLCAVIQNGIALKWGTEAECYSFLSDNFPDWLKDGDMNIYILGQL